MLIPVLGPIAIMGWHCEIYHRLCKGHDRPRPKLDFSDIIYYFKRGAMPFLVGLVVSLPLAFMFALAIVLVAVVIISVDQIGGSPILVVLLGIAGAVLIFFLGWIPLTVLSNAAMTRAYLTEEFGKAFDFKALIDYSKKTWGKVTLALLVFMPITFFISIAGTLCCYLGVYFVMVISNLAWIYLSWQIYEVYLGEGGEPIEMKTGQEPIPSEQPKPPLPPVLPQSTS